MSEPQRDAVVGELQDWMMLEAEKDEDTIREERYNERIGKILATATFCAGQKRSENMIPSVEKVSDDMVYWMLTVLMQMVARLHAELEGVKDKLNEAPEALPKCRADGESPSNR